MKLLVGIALCGYIYGLGLLQGLHYNVQNKANYDLIEKECL